MKSFIKFNNFIVLTTILLIFSISNAQMNSVTGVPDISKDPFLNNALSIDNWLPGGKNDDFSGSRGNVSYQREAYSIMPLSNMKMGVFSVQNAVVGAQHYYEKSFSNHPHWSHSPFDEVTSNSSSEKQYGTGSQTGYDISWTNTMIHPANGYDGMQGGGYPEPVGAYDTYSVNLSGMAVATYFVPEFDRSEYSPNWTDRNPLEHWNNAAIAAHDKLEKVLNDEDRNIFGKGIGVIASLIDGATSPLQGVVGIGSPELGAGYGQSSKVASEMFVSNFQNMSVSGQFEAIKIGDVLSCDTCGDVISVGGTLLAANQIKSIGKPKGKVPLISDKLTDVTSNPGTAQSRINLNKITSDNGHQRGFEYAMKKHGNNATTGDNKSKFSIPNDKVKDIIQSKEVVNTSVKNPIYSNNKIDTDKFIREVDVGKKIGIDNLGKKTSIITVITNRKGELINVYPGRF